MDFKTKQYFLFLFSKGKNWPARFLDQLLGTAALSFFFFFFFWSLHLGIRGSAVLGATMAAISWVAYRIWREFRLNKFVEKKEKNIAANLMVEQFLFGDVAQQKAIVAHLMGAQNAPLQQKNGGWFDPVSFAFCIVFPGYPEESISADELLPFCRQLHALKAKQYFLIAPSKLQPAAQAMAHRVIHHLKILQQDEILQALQKFGCNPSKKEIQQALAEEINGKQKQSLKEALFSSGKQKRYLVAALCLVFFWVITGRVSLLYPICAGILLLFFLISQWKKQPQH